jgi:hypothetical protein
LWYLFSCLLFLLEIAKKGANQMSHNESAGVALAGELSAMSLLKLLAGSTKTIRSHQSIPGAAKLSES